MFAQFGCPSMDASTYLGRRQGDHLPLTPSGLRGITRRRPHLRSGVFGRSFSSYRFVVSTPADPLVESAFRGAAVRLALAVVLRHLSRMAPVSRVGGNGFLENAFNFRGVL